jgi:hypothetical protein
LVNRLNLGLSEQIGAGLRELHIGPALVKNQPPALDCQFQASTVFGRRCALPKQKRRVDHLNVDATILLGLDTLLAISRSLRAAFSGSEYVRSVANSFHRGWGGQGVKTNAPMRPSAMSALHPSRDIVKRDAACPKGAIADSCTAAHWTLVSR